MSIIYYEKKCENAFLNKIYPHLIKINTCRSGFNFEMN